ncbi:MAG TPA: hypothetical protein VNC82_17395 [Candidatus Limnocylindria bacterium]|jgi:hypothetical protein|nr:hypothetical protein [Candidatus Limnocylindria bacterium]
MTVWDAMTWASIAGLGPGVLVICVAVARDLRRLLGGPAPPAAEDPHMLGQENRHE